MDEVMVGIPRGLCYYRYQYLWNIFFQELHISYCVSEESTQKTLEDGKNLAQDESCLSLKLFLGHVLSLKEHCKKILIPRIACLQRKEKVCTNFLVLPDLVRNLFSVDVLEFSIDEEKRQSEEDAFIRLGISLHRSYYEAKRAYRRAKEEEQKRKRSLLFEQLNELKKDGLKVLVVAHDYNLEDALIGKPILSFLMQNNIQVIKSSIGIDRKENKISPQNYWTLSKELLSSIEFYKNQVDGIILITAFPCGPDSLTNEMIQRKIKDVPLLSLILDEQNNDAGMITRLESFIDILKMKGRLFE